VPPSATRITLTVLAIALALVATSRPRAATTDAAREHPFEITSNKPFVQVTVNGSAPQWFVLDTGASGGSVVAKECAKRLGLSLGDEQQAHMGAGAGVDVGLSVTPHVTLGIGADTMASPGLRVFPLAHVSKFEGRRVDGLIGEDFYHRNVIELDYATRKLRLHDPGTYVPPPHAVVVPITIEDGLVVAKGTVAIGGKRPIPCRMVIDTGVRATVILYQPFSNEHHLLGQPGNLINASVGGGVGGETRGDIGRLDSLRIGTMSFPRATAIFSRDSVGVFAQRDPDAIVGGDLLRRARVTFDYPHQRLVLEPYAGTPPPFEYDMSGTFLIAEGTDFDRIIVLGLTARTPASEAGIQKGDVILAIDGRHPPDLTLEQARALLRKPGTYAVDVERDGRVLKLKLTTRRLV